MFKCANVPYNNINNELMHAFFSKISNLALSIYVLLNYNDWFDYLKLVSTEFIF